VPAGSLARLTSPAKADSLPRAAHEEAEELLAGLKALRQAKPLVTIDLPGEAWLPRDYCSDFRAKIDIYRRLSRATEANEVDELARELADPNKLLTSVRSLEELG
jgi:transcription-repair coupling factor (superfamily II helicase)